MPRPRNAKRRESHGPSLLSTVLRRPANHPIPIVPLTTKAVQPFENVTLIPTNGAVTKSQPVLRRHVLADPSFGSRSMEKL